MVANGKKQFLKKMDMNFKNWFGGKIFARNERSAMETCAYFKEVFVKILFYSYTRTTA